MAEYNPFKDFNPAFTKYEYLEPQTYNDPLFGELSTDGFSVLPNGNWVAPINQKQEETQSYYDTSFLDEMAARHVEDNSNYTIKQDLVGNKKRALEFFQSKGLNIFQAAGIVGNLIQESGLKPTIKGDKGKAFGIAQWHPDRQKGLKELAKLRGTDISDFNTQLEYVWKELNSTEKKALDKLLNSKNIQEATMAFMSYERPGDPQFQKRLNYANELLNG